MNRAERAHLAKVKSLPCCVCGAPPPSDAHHVICGRFGGKKPDAFHTIPLCKEHHQGNSGIHSGKKTWVERFGDDRSYLPAVLEATQ